jgi:gamma-glutamylcyclotransferase (GGCT)/AIG2-like uncharacterized protein YtfP
MRRVSRLFSYGSLQTIEVQMAVLGRQLEGECDELPKGDEFERGDGYMRRSVTPASGPEAWVYVDAATDSEYAR